MSKPILIQIAQYGAFSTLKLLGSVRVRTSQQCQRLRWTAVQARALTLAVCDADERLSPHDPLVGELPNHIRASESQAGRLSRHDLL